MKGELWGEPTVSMLRQLKFLASFVAPPALAALVFAPRYFPLLFAWLAGWAINVWLAHYDNRLTRAAIPLIFGATLLAMWEMAVNVFAIPAVILPAPSQIWTAFMQNIPLLWGDFVQTILRGALTGWLMGAALAVGTAISIDRSSFLQRGLLPIGNFVAALPIVGIAPILVMWFGFDWQSKAAVVVVMVFFPILVNMVAGLRATDALARDQIATWGASYGQALVKLRLPHAMPFLFNGLKITTTLALIGAIVAEFFGSPTRGMGFRISTAVGQLNMPLVWAEILVAALAGTAFYGIVALIEKRVTFWHPSQRA
ncbi:ABC transporter permease [Paracoccus laeviglucosivorans]|uniref:NitT/TauT family transport system permease protein n=1 Tax=Paracoccus laeviglucosivorans TaxID=1197861 RepID=A0A521BNS5_9RHOB|nr:ABC transporter permease [Paracoccus laeviglucosivorans]SMO48784.1 NitT/TauT family transport system permease protein [Paracoccus laeviglucosivorans]